MIPADRAGILHVDMDAFYASVMTRDRPDLQQVPVVVGGRGRGGGLSANYPARERGIRSGIPMTRARRLCPQATIVPPDFTTLSTVSASVMEIFGQVTPRVEALSLDEAFLDVAGSLRRFGAPHEIAEMIRARVRDEQGITCSVGAAGTATVAKMASRMAKPDGLLVVPPAQTTAFLHPLPVEDLWGVGEKTAERLRHLGLTTIGDLAHTPAATLQRALGPAAGLHLHRLAWGEDRRVIPGPGQATGQATGRTAGRAPGPRHTAPGWGAAEPEKSTGAEETFSRDVDDPDVVLRELLRLSAKVAARIRTAHLAGRTVTVKVRFADFTTITRSRTRAEATDVTREIFETAAGLFAALGLQRARIRLVGVRVEGLQPRASTYPQLVLGAREQGWADADRAVDRAVSRFGSAAVQPASLLRRHGLGLSA